MYMVCAIFFILFSAASVSAQMKEFLIQAEEMSGTISEIYKRPNGQIAVHLYQGNSLYTDICLMADTEIVVEVIYSNDGSADRLEVTLDSLFLGTFLTVEFTDWGRGWTIFRTGNGMSSRVAKGRHTLTLTVLKSDSYGVEIDCIRLKVNNFHSLASLHCKAEDNKNGADQLTEILIQAEEMSGTISEIYKRPNGEISVHLYQGNGLYTDLCFVADTEIVVEVVYSNDGSADKLQVMLDSLILGEFKTVKFTDWGRGWEIFRRNKGMFSKVAEGRHTLTLTVLESDGYGVEIDYIRLKVNHFHSLASLSCKAEDNKNRADQMTEILLEAEEMSGTISEINKRSNAYGKMSVHLYKGNSLFTDLCLMTDTELVVEVVYSNDGSADKLQVVLDSYILGEFKTVIFTDYGKGWEIFRRNKGMSSKVAKGRHTLTLTVLESDGYGVEIDGIRLKLNHFHSLAALHCNLFRSDETAFPYSEPDINYVSKARTTKQSVKTDCAEEDINDGAEMTDILIQAEEMSGTTSEIYKRTNANGHISLHLYKGNGLYTDLCLMADTEIVVEVVYSNDGNADKLQVMLDSLILGEFWTIQFTDYGRGWEIFRRNKGMFSNVAKGRHTLTITVLESDRYGVEIDYIRLKVNHFHSPAALRCKESSFDNTTCLDPKPDILHVSTARAIQRSVKTNCAEEDNINIPLVHDSASTLKFIVTASLPRYLTSLNNRAPDWTNCQMAEAFWEYEGIPLTHEHLNQEKKTSRLQITSEKATSHDGKAGRVWVIDVDFQLQGPKTGLIDSEIGTTVRLEVERLQGTLTLQFQYYNRYGSWSNFQNKLLENNKTSVEFITPDFSFKEGKGNKVRIKIFQNDSSADSILIRKLFMDKRWLKPDTATTLYKDESTIIEGVYIDMWWRINETMSVTIKDGDRTFDGIHYFRISRRVPWKKDSFSEVFVLYQDANIRLLPSTPYGFDLIPFGSSVIIGQTDFLSNRPSAPITRVDIDPDFLQVRIVYMDGSSVSMEIKTTPSETKLHVTGSHFLRDVNVYPFFTFRSMYVADGNNDVDHLSVDGGKPVKIIEQWDELRGCHFAFYRKAISKHNTQSPDISIQIES